MLGLKSRQRRLGLRFHAPTIYKLRKSSDEAKDNSKIPSPKGGMFQTPISFHSEASELDTSKYVVFIGEEKSRLQIIF